uniref:Uncharacterized protein n=1 Tax=Tetranychus urticae TaxID=32264 RepID=T1JR26_TETUR
MDYCLYYRNKGLPKRKDSRWNVRPVTEIRPVPPSTCIKPYDRILVKSESHHVCFAFEFGKQSTLRTKASKVAPAIEKEIDKRYSAAEPITETFDSQKGVQFSINKTSKKRKQDHQTESIQENSGEKEGNKRGRMVQKKCATVAKPAKKACLDSNRSKGKETASASSSARPAPEYADAANLASLWRNLESFEDFEKYCIGKLDLEHDRNIGYWLY